MTALNTRNASNASEETQSEIQQIEFSDQATELVYRLAKKTNQEVGQVISEALGVYDWVQQQRAMGLNIVGRTDSGEAINEINFPNESALSDRKVASQQPKETTEATPHKPKLLGRLMRWRTQ